MSITINSINYPIDKSIDSNRGFKVGDIITEVRSHPFIIKDGDKRGQWSFNDEILHFEIIEVTKHEYVCRYLDGYDSDYYSTPSEPFYWGFWDKQPNYGFMKDNATPVRYYIPLEATDIDSIDTSTNNSKLFSSTIKKWNCTALEAYAAAQFNCDTLESIHKAIQRAVTHERLLIRLVPGVTEYIKNQYKNENVSEDFIQSKIHELVKDEAWEFAYLNDILDDYETMTEAEKETAVYGKADNT